MRIEEVRTIKLNFMWDGNSPEFSRFLVYIRRTPCGELVYDLEAYDYWMHDRVLVDRTFYDQELVLDVADCLNYLIDEQTLVTDWDALMAEALEKFPAAADKIKKYLVTMGGDDD